MRVGFLFQGMTAYWASCLRALSARGAQIYVSHFTTEKAAPYDTNQFNWLDKRYIWTSAPDVTRLQQEISDFRPDILLVSSWHIAAYRKVLRRMKGSTVRVLSMDNQWLGKPKQILGAAVSPLFVRPLYDAVFVPGDRQATFARKLGFGDNEIFYGMYAVDPKLYAQHAVPWHERHKTFIQVSRLVPEKGIDVLVKAWSLYRKSTDQPWDLEIYGTGPLANLVHGVPGIIPKNFVQPDALAMALGSARCFVLPSYFEPWGVAVQEAASAGLGLITSSVCGSSPHLLQDGHNGFLVSAGDATGLAAAMREFSSCSEEEQARMGKNSMKIAASYTPDRWARTMERILERFSERNNKLIYE